MTTRIVTKAPVRDQRPLWNAGASRGARLGMPAIQNFNRTSQRFEIVPTYVDSFPGRSESLAAEARAKNIQATAEEARIEDFLATRPERDVPGLLNIDSATSVAKVLPLVGERLPALLAYQIVEMPDGRVYGVCLLIRRGEEELRDRATRLFETLGRLTERSGSEVILGPAGSAAARAVEPTLRRAFATHTVKNLTKVFAGLEPESPALEVVSTTGETAPLYIRETDGMVDPSDLAAEVANNPEHPMRRGTSFAIAETTPAGVRFHEARRRMVDDSVRVRERGLLERAVVDRSVAEGEAQRRAAEEEAAKHAVRPDSELSKLFAEVLVPQLAAIERPRTIMISTRNPIRTTD